MFDKVIFKYRLKRVIGEVQTLKLPKGAKVLDCQLQKQKALVQANDTVHESEILIPTLWTLEDRNIKESDKSVYKRDEERKFVIFWTGQEIDTSKYELFDDELIHISTYQSPTGIVEHVFELRDAGGK